MLYPQSITAMNTNVSLTNGTLLNDSRQRVFVLPWTPPPVTLQAKFFDEFQLEGVSAEANEICLELAPDNLSRALKTAQNAKTVKIKLTKKHCPCLTIAAELVSWISLFSRSTCFHLYEHYCWLGTTFNSTSIQNVYVEMFNLIDLLSQNMFLSMSWFIRLSYLKDNYTCCCFFMWSLIFEFNFIKTIIYTHILMYF